MQVRASERLKEGDLVCLATGPDGSTVLLRWRFGCEAVGVAARAIAEDEMVEFSPDRSSDDILVKGSTGPVRNKPVEVKAACNLKAEELVCLKLQADGKLLIDKWRFGEEAVGISTREIRAGEMVEFSEGKSTRDIHVKPRKTPA